MHFSSSYFLWVCFILFLLKLLISRFPFVFAILKVIKHNHALLRKTMMHFPHFFMVVKCTNVNFTLETVEFNAIKCLTNVWASPPSISKTCFILKNCNSLTMKQQPPRSLSVASGKTLFSCLSLVLAARRTLYTWNQTVLGFLWLAYST